MSDSRPATGTHAPSAESLIRRADFPYGSACKTRSGQGTYNNTEHPYMPRVALSFR